MAASCSFLNKALDKVDTNDPKTTVVKATILKAVVTITGLLTIELSILRTRPKATAPLIMPAKEMKISSFVVMPDL